jgi:hypothetical protein
LDEPEFDPAAPGERFPTVERVSIPPGLLGRSGAFYVALTEGRGWRKKKTARGVDPVGGLCSQAGQGMIRVVGVLQKAWLAVTIPNLVLSSMMCST